jgi:hypothetical protein
MSWSRQIARRRRVFSRRRTPPRPLPDRRLTLAEGLYSVRKLLPGGSIVRPYPVDSDIQVGGLFFWIFLLLPPAAPAVLAEFYLRTIGLGNPILYYADSSYRYPPRPNQKHVGQHGAAVTLDSKGPRGTKEWTAPADGKILFIGDSATWGGTYIDEGSLL